MGSDVIHLNDRKWNEELEKRLREEYEKRLDRKEEELAEAEALRIRKLKLDGVIPRSEDDDEENEYPHWNGNKRKEKRRRVKHGHRKRSQSPRNNKRCSSAPSRSVTRHKPSEDIRTQIELMKNSRSPDKDNHSDDGVTSGDRKSNSSQRYQKSNHTDSSERSTPEHSTKAKAKRQVPSEIRELYAEESVDGLYSLAERLVVTNNESRQVKFKVNIEQ